jgi:hypothetical protein
MEVRWHLISCVWVASSQDEKNRRRRPVLYVPGDDRWMLDTYTYQRMTSVGGPHMPQAMASFFWTKRASV